MKDAKLGPDEFETKNVSAEEVDALMKDHVMGRMGQAAMQAGGVPAVILITTDRRGELNIGLVAGGVIDSNAREQFNEIFNAVRTLLSYLTGSKERDTVRAECVEKITSGETH
jgi:hypothetical protein